MGFRADQWAKKLLKDLESNYVPPSIAHFITYAMEPTDGNPQKRHDLNVQAGEISSAHESAVPEQMFSALTQPVQGESAVAALQIAMSEGQRIGAEAWWVGRLSSKTFGFGELVQ
ncbi:MAG: hypothetical protein ACYDDO_13210 [Acidiferrobacterales bacterium]